MRLCFHLCLLVGWLVNRITQKLLFGFQKILCKDGEWFDEKPLNFGAELDKGVDPGILI